MAAVHPFFEPESLTPGPLLNQGVRLHGSHGSYAINCAVWSYLSFRKAEEVLSCHEDKILAPIDFGGCTQRPLSRVPEDDMDTEHVSEIDGFHTVELHVGSGNDFIFEAQQ